MELLLKFYRREFPIFYLLILCLSNLQYKVEAHILVYRRITSQLIDEYNDIPAQFGASLPPNGLRVFAVSAFPDNACSVLEQPPTHGYPDNAKFVALIQRGGKNCTFEIKVRNAQAAKFDAVIVYNNNGDDLEQMSAKNSSGINIPAVFVGYTTGMNLRSFYVPEIVLVINDELPFNINTQLILPFSILIGICFLIIILYMIYKCIREERRLRRYRLPKSMLKKLPIFKYSKYSDLSFDTCVICLDEFVEGDKLRILPCRHPYHSQCIDPWLTENRRVCPICKRKVFTKGEVRSRNRQSSLDSVTDTDDDTTPLLQHIIRNASIIVDSSTTDTTRATTTQHGTFRHTENLVIDASSSETLADVGSDEENVLLNHQSPLRSARRINPFDRASNLTAHLPERLVENRRSISSHSFFRLFCYPQTISVAASPYLEVVDQAENDINTVTINPSLPVATEPSHSSNNILNPNLSGFFKYYKNDEQPDRPIEHLTDMAVETNTNNSAAVNNQTTSCCTNPAADNCAVMTDVTAHSELGVVALPNTNVPYYK